jgi:predicted esterase
VFGTRWNNLSALSPLALFATLAWSGGCRVPTAEARTASPDAEAVELVPHTTAIGYQRTHRDEDLDAWRKRVPKVDVITIRSSTDGKPQRAIWYDSGATRERPLLIALHSWGADYEQNLDIPFAEFAIENDWVFLHPDFRGPNVRPEATASELAVQDVMDAVAYARKSAAVDASRVYLVGYSGGGMKALILAGRHPEVWGGVAAWGGIYDIADWYRHDHGKDIHYKTEIAASCGGVPKPGSAAEAECRQRSPASYLANAAGRVPILIAHGLGDSTVPRRHALLAYDALAAPQDRFTEAQRKVIDTQGKIPPDLRQFTGASDSTFDRAGAPARLERQSRSVTLVLYEGKHDMVYNAALKWLSGQHRR